MPQRKQSFATVSPLVVKPYANAVPPIPSNIATLVDPTMKRRAEILWRDCWLLRAAVDGQLNWFRQLRDTGSADPGEAYRLAEIKALCVGTLMPIIDRIASGVLDEPEPPSPTGRVGWESETLREYDLSNAAHGLQWLFGVAGNVIKAMNHDAETLLLSSPPYRGDLDGSEHKTNTPRVSDNVGGGRGEADGKPIGQKLRECDIKAGRQYDAAMNHAESNGIELPYYETAYDYYLKHLKDDYERVVPLASWKKFVSNYLKFNGRPKYPKGSGIETRSVVRSKSKNRTQTDRL